MGKGGDNKKASGRQKPEYVTGSTSEWLRVSLISLGTCWSAVLDVSLIRGDACADTVPMCFIIESLHNSVLFLTVYRNVLPIGHIGRRVPQRRDDNLASKSPNIYNDTPCIFIQHVQAEVYTCVHTRCTYNDIRRTVN